MFVPLSHLDRDREREREGSERRELAFMLIVDDGAAAAAASNFRANSWSAPSFSKKSTRRNFRYLFSDRPSRADDVP